MSETQSIEREFEGLLGESLASVQYRESTTFDRLAHPYGGSLVLFGAGFMGSKALRALREAGIEPLAFADDNRSLQGSRIDEVDVLSPEEASARFGQSAAFVVTLLRPEVPFSETAHRLHGLGCARVLSAISLFWKWPQTTLPHSFVDLPSKIVRQAEDVRRAYRLLADDESRRHFVAQIRYRMMLDLDAFPPELPVAEQYFPDDLIRPLADETFVDCGAFDGDTVKAFLQRRGSAFGRLLALEPDPVNCANLRAYVESFLPRMRDRIDVLALAASDFDGESRFSGKGTNGSFLSETGDVHVECGRLDTILAGIRPTYIKMDIEGAELAALAGAREVTVRTLPVLAICVYHEQDHLWRIPLYLHSLSIRYKLYLRAYMKEGLELVCYAIPPVRMTAGKESRKG